MRVFTERELTLPRGDTAPYEGSATHLTRDSPLGLERGERVTHGRAAHAQVLSQLALGRQAPIGTLKRVRASLQDQFAERLAVSGHWG